MTAPKWPYERKPLPEGEAVRLNKADYVVTAEDEVFVLFDRSNWMRGSPNFGKTERSARRIRDQSGPIATAVRAVVKLRAAGKPENP